VKSTVIRCEYVWLDGSKTQGLRSKTRVLTLRGEDEGWTLGLKDIPMWTFDGSSTGQAEAESSELILRPVFACVDSNRENGIIALCDVLNADMTPHETNHRARLLDEVVKHSDSQPFVGFEQEYFFTDGDNILGWPASGAPPREQGPYYCAVGSGNVAGRNLSELHLTSCINSGLSIVGVNAEVALGQWEYQIGGPNVNPVAACDHLWVSRFILQRISEFQNVGVTLDPKPIDGDWNGSGMHANFSTRSMRENGGINMVMKACEEMGAEASIARAISNYGEGLERRLTGEHETCSINEFRFGVGDRTASIRVPVEVSRLGSGYFEDRRPNSNADPYRVLASIMATVCPLERG
jgi:glutamine synthetase